MGTLFSTGCLWPWCTEFMGPALCQALGYGEESRVHCQGGHGLPGEGDTVVNMNQSGHSALELPSCWREF